MAFLNPIPIDMSKFKLKNKGVTFDENEHIYKINGRPCISVSSIISKNKEEFPTEVVLPKMVKKYPDTTKELWRTLFDTKRKRNTYLGKSLHEFALSEFLRPGYLQPITVQEIALLKAIDKLEKLNWRVVSAEVFNVSEKYLLGYTYDLLLYNIVTHEFAVGDYKQNEFFTEAQYKDTKNRRPGLMKNEFTELGFRDVTEYSVAIQLGLYSKLLKEESGINVTKQIAIHISPKYYASGYYIYDVTKRVVMIDTILENELLKHINRSKRDSEIDDIMESLYADL